jgi:hypothetical protein
VRRVVLLLIGAVALAGATAASAAHMPTGTFTTRIAGAPSPLLDGSWSLHFGAGRKYTISHAGRTAIVGRATFTSSTITFGHETGPLACTDGQARGVYRWRLSGRTLRFVRRSDACIGRRLVLAHAFSRRS